FAKRMGTSKLGVARVLVTRGEARCGSRNVSTRLASSRATKRVSLMGGSTRAAQAVRFALEHLLFVPREAVQAVVLHLLKDAADLRFLLGDFALLALPSAGIEL